MKQLNKEPFAFNSYKHIYGSTKPNYIKATDGINLAYYRIESTSTPKALLFFIHGAGAHCYMSDYQHIGDKLINNNINCYFIDIRGHGNSEGIRGTTPSKEQVWVDIRTILLFIIKEHSNIPVFLAGHSAGAGIVMNYATWTERIECNGYLLVSPYLGWRAKSYLTTMKNDNFAYAKVKYIVINILSLGLLFGNKTSVYYNYPVDVMKLDPLIISSISCNMSKSSTLWNPKKQFSLVKMPICIFIGSDDELFDPYKVIAYQQYVSNKLKSKSQFKIIPNLKHMTILADIDQYLANAIENIRLTTSST